MTGPRKNAKQPRKNMTRRAGFRSTTNLRNKILKVKEYNKRGEMIETAKGTPQALIESTNRSSFIIRASSNNSKVDQLYKEAEDIGSQADKLQKDNPNIFKS